MSLQYTDKEIYSNHKLLAPDGRLLCRLAARKSRWYLKKGLAKVVCDNPLTLKLCFEPNYSYKNNSDSFILTEKFNRCVVCGTTAELSMHHIVPRCFRKYFPLALKEHNYHDVLPLCVSCHTKYEVLAHKKKIEICNTLKINCKAFMPPQEINKALGYIKALKDHDSDIPEVRKQEMYSFITDHLPNGPDDWIDCSNKAFGQTVVDRLTDLPGFVKLWRRHFVENMKPQFLPLGWNIEREL